VDYHSGQRLPAVEEQPEYQRAFNPTRTPESGYRCYSSEFEDAALAEAIGHGVADLDEWARLFVAGRQA
jgi:hypothetical protein